MASRAHSFKENFLNVFAGANSGPGASGATTANDSNTDTSFDDCDKYDNKLQASKKTNSTDNIIDFVTTSTNTIADPRSTEVMVREVNLALRYFQDAVGKGTYELLPGCATVVLETVLALQSYAMSRRDPRSASNKKWNAEISAKISSATKAMCSSVAKLTQWADRVITDGCVDPTEDYVNQVIEPVRSAVNTVASNLLAISVVPKSTSFHNSLPDLASPEREKASVSMPCPVEKRHGAPPLPPKSKSQSQSDDSMDPVMSSASDSAHVDWFSNPLFDTEANLNSRRHRNRSGHHHHRHHHHTKKRSSRAFSESSELTLDTTLPDFCTPQRMSVCSQQAANVTLVPLATSSPRDYTSSSTSCSDIPPALPRKNRQLPPPPPPAPTSQQRKVSTYDNVFLPPAPFATGSLATFQSAAGPDQVDRSDENALNALPPPLPPKKKHIMSYMEMFGRSLVTTDEELVQSLTRTKDLLEAVWQQNYHDYSYNSMSSQYDLSSGGAGNYKHPSQRHPMNEVAHTTFQFSGMGVRPTTVLRTSISSYHLPPPELPPPPPPPLLLVAAQPVSGMPPPFPNLPDDEDDNQGDLEDDDDPTTETTDDIYPPALPPKRGPLSSRSWTSPASQDMSSTPTSHEDRIIPIVIEGRQGGPYRQESTCSAPAAPTSTPHEHRSYNHRFSDSMTSSTSSSGFGADIHSLRHSLPSPVMEASSSSQHQLMSESTKQQINDSQPSILPRQGTANSSRKSKTKETSPSASRAKRNSSKKKKNALASSISASGSVLDQIDVRKACLDMLVYTTSSGAPDDPSKAGSTRGKELLRAGSVDALIVLATQSVKNDFLYQEAFIATYRTFVTTLDLLEKLVQRFRRFNNRRDDRAQQQMINKRVAHCAFSLMVIAKLYLDIVARIDISFQVRVVDGLADCDFQDTSVMELLSDFIAELVSDGELILARALRTKFIQKYEDRKLRLLPDLDTSGLSSFATHNKSLLSFKSMELAEQMTLLDAQLFLRLDSAELILWVQEQNEAKSPNLNKFTEHFNNMSFWCRTKILQQEDAKEREKLVSKFIKIMKELRKHNNFNSYLALLSALDSAPIRRLEWCKSITEALKEHCALIDSSSSFRAYRQALSSAV